MCLYLSETKVAMVGPLFPISLLVVVYRASSTCGPCLYDASVCSALTFLELAAPISI